MREKILREMTSHLSDHLNEPLKVTARQSAVYQNVMTCWYWSETTGGRTPRGSGARAAGYWIIFSSIITYIRSLNLVHKLLKTNLVRRQVRILLLDLYLRYMRLQNRFVLELYELRQRNPLSKCKSGPDSQIHQDAFPEHSDFNQLFSLWSLRSAEIIEQWSLQSWNEVQSTETPIKSPKRIIIKLFKKLFSQGRLFFKGV